MATHVAGAAGNKNPHTQDYCLMERVVGKCGWMDAGDWRRGRLEEACMPSLEERIASLETRLDAAESTLAIERLKAEYAARVDSRHAHISAGAPDPAHVSEMAARVAELFTEEYLIARPLLEAMADALWVWCAEGRRSAIVWRTRRSDGPGISFSNPGSRCGEILPRVPGISFLPVHCRMDRSAGWSAWRTTPTIVSMASGCMHPCSWKQ